MKNSSKSRKVTPKSLKSVGKMNVCRPRAGLVKFYTILSVKILRFAELEFELKFDKILTKMYIIHTSSLEVLGKSNAGNAWFC